MTEALTHEMVKESLDYNPDTGLFVWKRPNKVRKAGDIAGSKAAHGYARVKIGQRHYLAHRLAWFWMTGAWPSGDIDHIDHNPSNNRIANLRDVTATENAQNQIRPQAGGTSGFLGVSFRKDRGRYKATITINGKYRCIGQFVRAEDAHAAYVAVKRATHSTCTI